jgi:hypothetical protein
MILVVLCSSTEKVFCFYAAWIRGFQRIFLLIFRSFDARYNNFSSFLCIVLVKKNAICHEGTSHKYEAGYFYRLLLNRDMMTLAI